MPKTQKKEYKPGTILNNEHYPGYFIMILNKEDCINLTKSPGGEVLWQCHEWRASALDIHWFIVKPKR